MKRREIKKLNDIEVDKLVKIQGTQFDRKRKLSDKDIKHIKKLLINNIDIEDIANIFGVTVHTIKYNTDPNYRAHSINIRSGKHYGETVMDMVNRATYKRSLVLKRKIKV